MGVAVGVGFGVGVGVFAAASKDVAKKMDRPNATAPPTTTRFINNLVFTVILGI